MKFFQCLSVITAFCFVLVLGTNTVYADTYTLGAVTFVGNINSGTYTPSGNIIVTGSISNSNPYSAIPAYLTATTNGSTQTVVSQQNISAGGSTGPGQAQFQAPSAAGSYTVALGAAANTPPAQQVVGFSISINGVGSSCSSSGADACVSAFISLNQALTQPVTLTISDEYWDSGVNGPDSIGFSITIPAGQTEGSQTVTLNPAGTNTYLSSSGQYTSVNGESVSSLLGGALLSAYANTKLQLEGSSVGYNFACNNNQHPNSVMCY